MLHCLSSVFQNRRFKCMHTYTFIDSQYIIQKWLSVVSRKHIKLHYFNKAFFPIASVKPATYHVFTMSVASHARSPEVPYHHRWFIGSGRKKSLNNIAILTVQPHRYNDLGMTKLQDKQWPCPIQYLVSLVNIESQLVYLNVKVLKFKIKPLASSGIILSNEYLV